jgi:PAS domain S-box-containing protein
LAEIFGYTVEEILNLNSYLDLIHQDSRELATQEALASLSDQSAKYVVCTLRGLRKDGAPLYIEAMASINRFWGEPVLHGNIIDITRSYLAQEALKISEERYRVIVEDQNDLIVRIGLDGTATFVNEAVCQYLNENRDGIVGKRYYRYTPG